MKILITGGAGYLGTALCEILSHQGAGEVIVYDSLRYGGFPVLHLAHLPGVKFVKGDVTDLFGLQPLVEWADKVVHLAALVGYPVCDACPDEAYKVNVFGTDILAGLIGNREWIFASTGSTYGKVDGVATEDTPINPLTIYGRTKAEAERIAVDSGAIALRFATVFGVSLRMRYDLLINNLVYDAVRLGRIVLFEPEARRTFLHVRDAAWLLYSLIMRTTRGLEHQVYNVSNPRLNLTKLQVGEAIAKLTGATLDVTGLGKDPDARDYAVDYSRGLQLYRPHVSLEEGIAELIQVCRYVDRQHSFTLGNV